MVDKKKRYVIPEAEIIDFTMEDIITESLNDAADALAWGGEDNIENM